MTHRDRWVVLFLLTLARPAASLADDAPKEEASYFLGEAKVTTPEGKPIGSMVMMVKRVVKPSEKKVFEHVLVVDPRNDPKQPLREYVAVFEVDGAKCAVKEQGGSFTGEGEMIGEPWAWKRWKSTSKLANNGGSITSDDALTERGMTARKKFFSPDGTHRVNIREEYDRVSKEMYDILHDRLTTVPKSE